MCANRVGVVTRDLHKKLSIGKPVDDAAESKAPDSETESETEPESPLPAAKGKAVVKLGSGSSTKPSPGSKAAPETPPPCSNCSYLQNFINDLQEALKDTREDLHEAQKNRLSYIRDLHEATVEIGAYKNLLLQTASSLKREASRPVAWKFEGRT